MSARTLPHRPDWEQLRSQAKDRLRERRSSVSGFRLHQAQRELAAEYGFASWSRLKKHVAFRTLIAALEDDDLGAVRSLIDQDRALIAYPEDGGPTALHWAAWHGRLAATDLLIRAGADLDRAESEFGARPSGWANENGQDAVRDLLIERGARIDLSRAAMMGRLDLVERILREDPDQIRRIDPEDWPPLVQAAGWGRIEVVKALLAAGADPDAAGLERTTPLHAAAGWRGEAEAVRVLLDHGADPARLDSRSRTARQLAEERGLEEVAVLLIR